MVGLLGKSAQSHNTATHLVFCQPLGEVKPLRLYCEDGMGNQFVAKQREAGKSNSVVFGISFNESLC